jgi:hypothetical protein
MPHLACEQLVHHDAKAAAATAQHEKLHDTTQHQHVKVNQLDSLLFDVAARACRQQMQLQPAFKHTKARCMSMEQCCLILQLHWGTGPTALLLWLGWLLRWMLSSISHRNMQGPTLAAHL